MSHTLTNEIKDLYSLIMLIPLLYGNKLAIHAVSQKHITMGKQHIGVCSQFCFDLLVIRISSLFYYRLYYCS